MLTKTKSSSKNGHAQSETLYSNDIGKFEHRQENRKVEKGLVESLIDSILRNGYLPEYPMVVIKLPNGKFMVIEGNNRRAALQQLYDMGERPTFAYVIKNIPFEKIGEYVRDITNAKQDWKKNQIIASDTENAFTKCYNLKAEKYIGKELEFNNNSRRTIMLFLNFMDYTTMLMVARLSTRKKDMSKLVIDKNTEFRIEAGFEAAFNIVKWFTKRPDKRKFSYSMAGIADLILHNQGKKIDWNEFKQFALSNTKIKSSNWHNDNFVEQLSKLFSDYMLQRNRR